VFVLIVSGLVVIVLPTLVTNVSELVSVSSKSIPKSVNALTNFLESIGLLSGQIGDQIASFLEQL
ncbi:AI-2E family transporter, partial [Streptococcus suis]